MATANAALEMAGHLADLPAVAEAFRAGRLSEAQAREIAATASEVPDAQDQLVEAAGKLSLRGLQEECRRVEAAARLDEDAGTAACAAAGVSARGSTATGWEA